jgi:hypothetical protein
MYAFTPTQTRRIFMAWRASKQSTEDFRVIMLTSIEQLPLGIDDRTKDRARIPVAIRSRRRSN